MKFSEVYLQRVRELIPEKEQEAFLNAVTAPLDRVIRVQTDTKNLPKDWMLTPMALEGAFGIEREDQQSRALGNTLPHFAGEIYVQSLSSMLPVFALDPQPEQKILDLCSAPGSKSTLISAHMRNSGCLITNEISGSRSKKLVSNLNRMKVLNAIVMQSDAVAFPGFLGQEFDKVLLDAPCSSEGYGRKEAGFFEKKWNEKNIFACAKLQKKMIESAFKLLKPGGSMVYSTCTTAPEENESVVQFLVDNYKDALVIEPIDMMEGIPHRKGITQWRDDKFSQEVADGSYRLYPHVKNEKWDSECFYLCKITKTRGIPLTPAKKPEERFELEIIKKNRRAELITYLCKTFGIEKSVFDPFALGERNQQIILTTKECLRFAKTNMYRRLGVPILDKDQNITTEFCQNFGAFATKQVWVIETEEEYVKWMQGQDIRSEKAKEIFEGATKGSNEIIVLYKNRCLGHGKWHQERIKNKLDRNLVWR